VEDFVMADPPIIIAYAPLKRVIKQEIPDQEEEDENWTLQVNYYSLFG